MDCSESRAGYAWCGDSLGTVYFFNPNSSDSTYKYSTGAAVCLAKGYECDSVYTSSGNEYDCYTTVTGYAVCGSAISGTKYWFNPNSTDSSYRYSNGTLVCAAKGLYCSTVYNSYTGEEVDCSDSIIGIAYCTSTQTCYSFSYSSWGTCSSGGTQTRTVTASYPFGYTGGTKILFQSCTPTCTSFSYSSWGACDASGQKYRTISSSYPSRCTGGNPILTQSCASTSANICTTFTYSNWGACNSSGFQNRTISYTYPANCTGGAPVLTQSCTPTTTTTNGTDNTVLIAQLQAQIASLTAQIQAIIAQRTASGTDTNINTNTTITTTNPTIAWCHTFNSNLGYAESGSSEVSDLHIVLDKEGISYSTDTGDIYGVPTMNAVTSSQQKYSISPATGWVGPLTRVKLNSLYGCE